ncbi:MAG: 4-hydroxy-tetrahydrodipicolinate reductase [Myxococcota bacterium]|nr:4-hydroxy-tetrahydrodipicolinate reductase [Myxococcota bacterium]
MLRIAMHGAAGRMGRAIVRAISEDESLALVAALDREGSDALGRDAGELAQVGPIGIALVADRTALRGADVVIDFSSPAATAATARACAASSTPMVIGTTGLDADADAAIGELAAKAAVVVAPNTSVGVNVLFHLAAEAARLLGPDFDAEIVEMHHKKKVDSPSGTAVRLAERVAAAKGLGRESFVHGRSGQVGARPAAEIGIMTLRGGDVIGEHTLVLAGPGERIELTHRAHDRSLFALGALRAARWAAAQKTPGRYDMADVLAIR